MHFVGPTMNGQCYSAGSGPNVGLAAGGTGGHVLAALAVAEELFQRGIGTVLFTDSRGAAWSVGTEPWQIEKVSAETPFRTLPVAGRVQTLGRRVVSYARAGVVNFESAMRSVRLIDECNVRTMIGFGGYPMFPACLAAQVRRIPLMIHEQNCIVGRANLAMLKRATVALFGFPGVSHNGETICKYSKTVGNPVRLRVLEARRPYVMPAHGEPFNLLLFGGSQGSVSLVQLFVRALARIDSQKRKSLHVVCQCPSDITENVEQQLARLGVSSEVRSFFRDMPERISDAHLVVARGGASSVTELALLARPSIIVPLPGAIDNDQLLNGNWMASKKVAICREQVNLSPEGLGTLLSDLMNDSSRLADMSAAASRLMPDDGAARIAGIADALARENTTSTTTGKVATGSKLCGVIARAALDYHRAKKARTKNRI